MVLASFQIEDKLKRALFFQKTFLLVDINIKVILRMFFFIFSNVDIQFAKKYLISRFYTAAEALPISKRVEIIDKKKFAKAALDENIKAFVIYVTVLSFYLLKWH